MRSMQEEVWQHLLLLDAVQVPEVDHLAIVVFHVSST